MRWNRTPTPKVGDERTVTRFLWLPKEINYEVRWLERATWTEHRYPSRHGSFWNAMHWQETRNAG